MPNEHFSHQSHVHHYVPNTTFDYRCWCELHAGYHGCQCSCVLCDVSSEAEEILDDQAHYLTCSKLHCVNTRKPSIVRCDLCYSYSYSYKESFICSAHIYTNAVIKELLESIIEISLSISLYRVIQNDGLN